ncbi:hypothetical protein [Dyella sp. 2RAB6]|uniref:hypothetical protein n=1 Tax=Dyella sp. 2RAB6 TaxID=3232992 RepID=UPI003F8EAEE0
MKIASKIHPRDGKPRTHVVHGTTYKFAPTQDRNGEIHFVADVANPDHGALFMRNGSFYHFDDDLQVPPLTRIAPPAPAAPPSPPAPAADSTSNPLLTQFDQAVLDEAGALVAGSMTTIGTAIGSVSGAPVVLAALAIEKAKESPRKSVLELLEKTVDGLRAAGLLSDKP